MWPLLACSLAVWGVILERFLRYRKLESELRTFHLEALNVLLGEKGPQQQYRLRSLCGSHPELPSSRLLLFALERISSTDARVRGRWKEAVERRRVLLNQDLRRGLWVLGTVASAAPFIGLFGTVVGILRSFQEMAKTGAGGFAVVAAGISEALVATAAGIVVAVVAVMAYNAFQTRFARLVLLIRVQVEEATELLE